MPESYRIQTALLRKIDGHQGNNIEKSRLYRIVFNRGLRGGRLFVAETGTYRTFDNYRSPGKHDVRAA